MPCPSIQPTRNPASGRARRGHLPCAGPPLGAVLPEPSPKGQLTLAPRLLRGCEPFSPCSVVSGPWSPTTFRRGCGAACPQNVPADPTVAESARPGPERASGAPDQRALGPGTRGVGVVERAPNAAGRAGGGHCGGPPSGRSADGSPPRRQGCSGSGIGVRGGGGGRDTAPGRPGRGAPPFPRTRAGPGRGAGAYRSVPSRVKPELSEARAMRRQSRSQPVKRRSQRHTCARRPSARASR